METREAVSNHREAGDDIVGQHEYQQWDFRAAQPVRDCGGNLVRNSGGSLVTIVNGMEAVYLFGGTTVVLCVATGIYDNWDGTNDVIITVNNNRYFGV